MPGARLCGPCRAALKRARHGGEADAAGLDDETIVAGGAPHGDRGSDGVAGAQGVPVPPRRRRWPAVVMLASMLGAAAYVVPRSHFVRGESHAAADLDALHRAPASPANAASTLPPSTVAQAFIAAAPEHQAADAWPPHERGPDRRANPRRERPSRAVDSADQKVALGPAAPAAPSVGPTLASQAPVAIAEVTRTRWQSMDDAMAACRGGFFDRLLCRQKARIAFCDGYWGRVPECATAAATEETR